MYIYTHGIALWNGCENGFTKFSKTFVWRILVHIFEMTFLNWFTYFLRCYYVKSISLKDKLTLKKWVRICMPNCSFCKLSLRRISCSPPYILSIRTTLLTFNVHMNHPRFFLRLSRFGIRADIPWFSQGSQLVLILLV